ncbi:TRAP transporter small permease [Amaricoccus sp.]|uniref:TRAP transporter small permease n=1 Tax=Amaricoccus sp. TaxID=1872485 RepID=UPI001B7C615F|nr:TRAP transporter small permease [Amaricoccus sp.]MBP7242425.1 TRAP transporter small permease [Amaricoccus sp.]
MQHRLQGLARVLGALSHAALWIASVGMIAMTVIVAWQVFARYVLNSSPSWTEPVSVMVMSWFIFLGAAVGVRENFHMGFDVLIHFLPGAGPWMRAISDLAVLVFGLGMVVYGLQLTIDTWTAILPVLGLPGGFTYMPIVGGGALMTLFALERVLLRASGVVVDHDPNAEEIAMTSD